MNAADVLHQAEVKWNWHAEHNSLADEQIAALLAHGEQGVAILPDGTLWALRHLAGVPNTGYVLVPVPSAEAGDTDG